MGLEQTMTEILMRILSPFKEPFTQGSNVYWLYLFSGFGLATLLYRFKLTNQDNHKNLLEYLFPKEIYLHSSFITQCKQYFATCWYTVFILIPLIGVVQKNAQDITSQALTQITGITTVFEIKNPQLVHYLALTIFTVLIADFGFFVGHYIAHKIPFLWEFHKAHHSAEVLTPFTTSYLYNPFDLFVIQIINFTVISIGSGIWIYIFGNQMQELLIFGDNIIIFILFLVNNLQHSHFWVAYPYWIGHILCSPAQHQIHHSVDPKHWDKNFGSLFSLWDWMIGSLYVPRGYEKLDFGLPDGESKLFNGVTNIFLQPFRAVWQRSRQTSDRSELGGESHSDPEEGSTERQAIF
ncbi:sterol desaturase family protein [Kamptonema sp. UHCC 0994]|uniref:sterol desaturase family protein n=1 Tax=Kamptonema sp. UHCC 0994 TaxID=3031329 RepID=UPI0023B914CA|nr:sterol desaturase family protein [Kamptonema sp. UHCC 0994]MDF0555524.1 sterol desaturase family protein [Kamptonema sp. UHCC 0994]